MKVIADSCVGQKMIEAGTQAIGGVGRSTSNTGKPMPWATRLIARDSPNGIPMIMAAMHPLMTRNKLMVQLCQYLVSTNTAVQESSTAEGAGTAPTQGR